MDGSDLIAYVLVGFCACAALSGVLTILSPLISRISEDMEDARNCRIINGTATKNDIKHNERVTRQKNAVFGGVDPSTPKISNLPINMTSRMFTVRLESAIDQLDAHCIGYTRFVNSLAKQYRCEIIGADRGITAYVNPLDNCVAAFTTVTYTAYGDWNDDVARAFLSNISANALEQWSRIR